MGVRLRNPLTIPLHIFFEHDASSTCTVQFRVFQQVLSSPPADKSDDLQLILLTCKFLDLVVTLQTEEFQV